MRLHSIRLRTFAAAAVAVAAANLTGSALAAVKLPALFTDHMVLQRDQANPVWGTAEKGEKVTVTIGDQSHAAEADQNGQWRVKLSPLPAGGPHTLIVKGTNEVKVSDVLVGEVWICSGQSNMQWEVHQSNEAELEARTAKFPNIRFISVPQVGTQQPQSDFNGKWETCTPDTAARFSAVGYFFGRTLHQALDVPVGLIDDAWGGSAAEAWVARDVLEKDGKYADMLKRWDDLQKQSEDPAARAKYEEQVAAAKAANKPVPQAPWGQLGGNHRPANIYNGVLKPTIGYGIKGVIWYQGESNAGRAYQYRDLFPLMIQSWRDEWKQGDFPFYWVQLADFQAEKPEPGESDWAELREAQTMTMKLPKTGQAIIIDIGEAQDIHPRNKQGVAARLARWALANDYGVKVNFRSPEYKSMEKKDGKVVLTFDHVGGGLKGFDVAEARGFAVAGDDKKWVWAKGKITGPNTIEVEADAVKNPVAVRYAWANNPVCNVYSREGLPLTPFRTDDWPGVTINNK